MFNLKGKVALVTGGNGGIGLGMAEAVAKAGADVCIWGTNADKNAAALAQLRPHGTRVVAVACDVRDEAAVGGAMDETLAHFGRLDACFANAGVGSGGRFAFHEMPVEEWRRVMSVNLDGLFFTLRAAAKHMVARAEAGDPGGRLIGVSSLAALCGMRRGEHYAAAKAAVTAITQGLSVEYARYGITANAILPGHIETPMTEKTYQWEKFVDAIMPRIPLRRWGTPADFGGIAVYLMSDASSYHTGDSMLIDGGFFRF